MKPAAVVFFSFVFFHSFAVSAQISRVNVSSSGEQGAHSSFIPASINADGRFVAFESNSTNLVETDRNTGSDIFVHDRRTGITEMVNLSSLGVQGNNTSSNPSISADGRYVAFESHAMELVDNDNNGTSDVFVHDRITHLTEMVSVSSSGVQANSYSNSASISGDGRFVTFRSFGSNLVKDDTNENIDIFVHDRNSGETQRVSISSTGVQTDNTRYSNREFSRPSISSDGRFIVFDSSVRYLVEGDTNQSSDIFLHDRRNRTTKRVNISPGGRQANNSSSDPEISGDGRFVVFESLAWNLVTGDTAGTGDVFIRNLNTGVTEIVNLSSTGEKANNYSSTPSVSVDGRFVAFASTATNLVEDDTNVTNDIFMHDRRTGKTERLNVSADGQQANNYSAAPSISNDGEFVAFGSSATNLVDSDTNQRLDIFVAKNSLTREFGELSVVLRTTSGATQVGEYIRFRAEFKNNSDTTLTNCTAQIINPLINFQREFSFYSWPLKTANPQLNASIDIAAGESGQIRLAVLPRVSLVKEVIFDYSCDSTKAIIIPFENTVHLIAKTEPLISEDFVQLFNANKKTVLEIDRDNGKYWTAYVIKVENTGIDSTSINLTTTTDIPDELLGQPRLCEPADPVNGNWSCNLPRASQTQLSLAAGEVKKVLVFVNAKQPIEQNPATNRIFIEALDQTGEIVAKNSIGIYTIN